EVALAAATVNNRVGNQFRVDANGANGIIVTRHDHVYAFRRAVRIDNGNDRNTQFARLVNRNAFVADIDDEQRIRQAGHFLDAADTALELVHFALATQRFALVELVDGAVLEHLLQVFQTLDRVAHGLEVRQHAAEPAVIDIGHAGALRLF